MDPRNFAKSLPHRKPMKSLIEAPLDKAHPDHIVKDDATLPKEKQVQLINFLKENIDVFVWLLRDILKIDPNVA